MFNITTKWCISHMTSKNQSWSYLSHKYQLSCLRWRDFQLSKGCSALFNTVKCHWNNRHKPIFSLAANYHITVAIIQFVGIIFFECCMCQERVWCEFIACAVKRFLGESTYFFSYWSIFCRKKVKFQYSLHYLQKFFRNKNTTLINFS